MNLVAAIAIGVIFGCGVHLMMRGDAVKLAAGTVLLSNAAVLLLVSAGLGVAEAPLLPVDVAGRIADPLVQALAITAVVIGLGTTVLLLRVALALQDTHDTLEMQELVAAETAEGEDAGDPEVPVDREGQEQPAEVAP